MEFVLFKEILYNKGHDAIEDFLGFETQHTDKDVLSNLLDQMYDQMPVDVYQAFVKKYAPIRYFECSFDNAEVIEQAEAAGDREILMLSNTQENICIRALRRPTLEEAQAHLAADIGNKVVWDIGEITREQAYAFYDMDNPTLLFGAEGKVWSND